MELVTLPTDGYVDDALPLSHQPFSEDVFDPYLASFHRGELKGLRGRHESLRTGFVLGASAVLVGIAVGAVLVAILTWTLGGRA